MQLLIILIFGLIKIANCREIYYEDLMYFPKESNDIIDYGSLKLTRSKNKTLIFLKGNFSVLQQLGNEKLVVMELHNKNSMMMTKAKPFCEFVREETIFWPSLVKSSDMPRDNPCPFPTGDYVLRKFSKAFSKSMVQPLPNGVYTMNIIMKEADKDLLKFVVVFSVKRS